MNAPSVSSKSGYENHVNAQYKKPLAIVTALALLALGVIAIGLLGHFNVIDLGSRSSKLLIVAGGSALLVSVIAICLLQCKKSFLIAENTKSEQDSSDNLKITIHPVIVAALQTEDEGDEDVSRRGSQVSSRMLNVAKAQQRISHGKSLPQPLPSASTHGENMQITVAHPEMAGFLQPAYESDEDDESSNNRLLKIAGEQVRRSDPVMMREAAKKREADATTPQAAQS